MESKVNNGPLPCTFSNACQIHLFGFEYWNINFIPTILLRTIWIIWNSFSKSQQYTYSLPLVTVVCIQAIHSLSYPTHILRIKPQSVDSGPSATGKYSYHTIQGKQRHPIRQKRSIKRSINSRQSRYQVKQTTYNRTEMVVKFTIPDKASRREKISIFKLLAHGL